MSGNTDFDFDAFLAEDSDDLIKNPYISDPDSAVDFIAELLHEDGSDTRKKVNDFKKKIDSLFEHLKDISLRNELEFYTTFHTLCEKLYTVQKIQKLSDKTVVSFGGKFSSGKSSFINSIAGLNNILPEAQAPTTSIPTYIVSSDTDVRIANTMDGRVCVLSQEQIDALSHKFLDEFKINLAPFVESIIVESSQYSLNSKIALLDTPGYTKAEDNVDSQQVLTDKIRAREQLKITDFLIWLVDIDNGTITENDIEFIDNLGIQTPILIVFNKADLKDEENIMEIVEEAIKTTHLMQTKCFGVAAYSSLENKEYTDRIIEKFFDHVTKSKLCSNNIYRSFCELEIKMKETLSAILSEKRKSAKDLLDSITMSQDPSQLGALSKLWSINKMESKKLTDFLKIFDCTVDELNKDLVDFINNKKDGKNE